MTTTKMMELKTVDPAYLIARADCDTARKAHRRAKGRAEIMESRNVEHAAEVQKKSRSGSPMLTNGLDPHRRAGWHRHGRELRCARCRTGGGYTGARGCGRRDLPGDAQGTVTSAEKD